MGLMGSRPRPLRGRRIPHHRWWLAVTKEQICTSGHTRLNSRLSAFSTSSRVVDTERAVYINTAVVCDADCRICLVVALIFSHAVVKSTTVTGVGGSELAFLFELRRAFHCDIVNSGMGTSRLSLCIVSAVLRTASVLPQVGRLARKAWPPCRAFPFGPLPQIVGASVSSFLFSLCSYLWS